jgi:glutamyl-tRNA(Gln) amidotransferase subunit E
VYAGLASGIGGIIHSDEMPGYGFSDQEINDVKALLHLDAYDAFVLALGDKVTVEAALEAVLRRAAMFFDGVPEEVRRSMIDGTTEYMRPLPGAARMYPETDVPPVRITKQHLDTLRLPERPEEKRMRLAVSYYLNDEQIKQLLTHGYEDEFELLAARFPLLQHVISRTFINTFAELEGEAVPVESLNEHILTDVLTALQNERFSKEAVPSLIRYLAMHPSEGLEDALKGCGIQAAHQEEIVRIIQTIVSERKEFIRTQGNRSVGPLMGVVMKELRGKADGRLISTLLEQEIHKLLST